MDASAMSLIAISNIAIALTKDTVTNQRKAQIALFIGHPWDPHGERIVHALKLWNAIGVFDDVVVFSEEAGTS